MVLSEVCIKRPVFATVLSLLVLLVGLISYSRLTVREYPQIDEPVVSVGTVYKGASAEVIESQITKPLEDSLSGIEGVEVMTSTSRSERSNINVRFRLSISPDSAAADVRDKVARVRGRLPDEIDEPIIAKVEADSQPVMYLAVESGSLSAMETSDYINRFIKPRLSVLPGAAEVRVFGERLPAMRINVDRGKLAAYRLTVQDVEDALRKQNVEIPRAGSSPWRGNSPSSPPPTCAPGSSSRTSSSPTSAATACASATSPRWAWGRWTNGSPRVSTASRR